MQGFSHGGPPSQTACTAGGASGTVNDTGADQLVKAAVVGDDIPWPCRTRQNFVPAVSERRSVRGFVSWGACTSMSVNDEFLETSTS